MTGAGYNIVLSNFAAYTKRYLLTDTFFIALNKVPVVIVCAAILFPSPGWSDNCALSAAQSEKSLKVTVEKVIDGDTLRLSSGKLVRLIGINTPEIDHRYGRSQAFAEDARDYLQSAVNDSKNSLLLVPGTEKQDRHSRLLAHLFSPSGRNIQADMLREGFAVWIVVPPNLAYLECYRENESLARNKGRKIWEKQYRTPVDTRSLTDKEQGFQWMQGKVRNIGKGRSNWWLNFEDSRSVGKFSKVTLRVHKDDLHYFDKRLLENLPGKLIRVKGWLTVRNRQLVMSLRHPASLEVVE